MKQFLYASALLLSTLSPNIATAETWNVDSSHSEVGFEVTHMMISTVEGSFGEFSGTIEVRERRLVQNQNQISSYG